MKKFKFTWGHGMIVALGCFMIFITTLILFFGNSSKNSFDLVTDDYYNKGGNYQDELNAVANTKNLKQKPKIIVSQEGVTVQFPSSLKAETGMVHLYRPSDKNLDRNYTLHLNAYNQFNIKDSVLKKGKYELKVKWKTNNKSHQIKQNIEWK